MSETVYTCQKCGQVYEKEGSCCGVSRDAEMVIAAPPGTIPSKYDDGKGNPAPEKK